MHADIVRMRLEVEEFLSIDLTQIRPTSSVTAHAGHDRGTQPRTFLERFKCCVCVGPMLGLSDHFPILYHCPAVSLYLKIERW
jgi:hypothetical protein